MLVDQEQHLVGLVGTFKDYDDLIVMTADVSTSAGLDRLENHPDKYIDVGIAEQNMIGIAAGLARKILEEPIFALFKLKDVKE